MLIFPGAVGDLLLVLPTLRLLRDRYAGARTTLVVGEARRELARLTGIADVVASLDDASTAWLFGGSVQPSWLADRPSVFSWMGAGDAALTDRLAAVTDNPSLLSVERGPGPLHAAIAYARAAGLRATRRRLAALAAIRPPDAPRARMLVEHLDPPVLAIHRGAGAPAKRWAPEGFATLALEWRRAGGSVVELLGPAEAGDEPLAGAVAVREWSLADVSALLGLVDGYVGNDSGISHLAAAVGARGVVVFCATDPRRWRPLSSSLVALRGRATDRSRSTRPRPSPARVQQALARLESLTSSEPGSSVRA